MNLNWASVVKGMERRGWSLTAIGKAAGMAATTVSDIKQGRTKAPRGMAAIRLYELHTSKAKPK